MKKIYITVSIDKDSAFGSSWTRYAYSTEAAAKAAVSRFVEVCRRSANGETLTDEETRILARGEDSYDEVELVE